MTVPWDSEIWVAERVAANRPLSTLLVRRMSITGVGDVRYQDFFAYPVGLLNCEVNLVTTSVWAFFK